ncbi:MAG: hypothetical protein R8M45_11915 [Ghiorsea sp.]
MIGIVDKDTQLASVFPGDGQKSRCKVMAATPVKLLHLAKKCFMAFAEQRTWLLQTIMSHARKPVRLQVTDLDDNYFWRNSDTLKGQGVSNGDW